jgi:hypothetical protein
MKKKKFKVYFESGLYEIVFAVNKLQAQILAQAKQIEKGNDFLVKKII